VSGISGLATKTSYIMFLLKAIQKIFSEEVAIIVLNVKGDDLLHLDKKNTKITEAQKEDWTSLGIPCEPFENVQYFYPFHDFHNAKKYSETSLPDSDLIEQYEANQAYNYVYTFEHDSTKLEMMFSNIDDPNFYY
jgi:hypothetical protein